MKKYLALAILLAVGAAPASAQAVSSSITINILSPAATSMACPLVNPDPSNPNTVNATEGSPQAAAGALVCPLTVLPSNWSGALVLSGLNASSFAIVPGGAGVAGKLVVGAQALTARGGDGAGHYNVTVTATP
jgi:hypothetical protein